MPSSPSLSHNRQPWKRASLFLTNQAFLSILSRQEISATQLAQMSRHLLSPSPVNSYSVQILPDVPINVFATPHDGSAGDTSDLQIVSCSFASKSAVSCVFGRSKGSREGCLQDLVRKSNGALAQHPAGMNHMASNNLLREVRRKAVRSNQVPVSTFLETAVKREA